MTFRSELRLDREAGRRHAPVGTALEGWEHIPPRYDEWKKAGRLPLVLGATDTHSGFYNYPERTVILAPSSSGSDLAEAIRQDPGAWDIKHTNYDWGLNE